MLEKMKKQKEDEKRKEIKKYERRYKNGTKKKKLTR